MYKRGLLFLLVFIIFLQSVLSQAVPDSCLAVPQNPNEEQLNQLITEAAAIIWNTYSQIQKYSGDNNKILKAALEGLEIWEPEPPYAILSNYKERIADEMGRQAGGSGSCIDDYSLNAKDDCWNMKALCVENRCVKFEDMGWSEENLDRARELRQGTFTYYHIEDPEELRPIFPLIVRYIEGEGGVDGSKYDLIIKLNTIGGEAAVDALLRIYAESQSLMLIKEARKSLGSVLATLDRYYISGQYDKDEIESLGYSKIMNSFGVKKTARTECRQSCWSQDALCIEGNCKRFNEFNWDENFMRDLTMLKSQDDSDESINAKRGALTRFSNRYRDSGDIVITQILDNLMIIEDSSDVREGVMSTLESLGSPDSINIFIRALKFNEYVQIRRQAALYLDNTRYPEQVIPHLIEAIQMDDYELVKTQAVNSLSLILSTLHNVEDYQEAIELLISSLSDAEGDFRYSIIGALDRLSSLEDNLLMVLETEQDQMIRKGIVEVLGRKTSPESYNSLIRILETDPSDVVKIAATYSLAQRGSIEAVPDLLRLLALEKSPYLKDGYALTLRDLIHKNELSSTNPNYMLLYSYLKQNVPYGQRTPKEAGLSQLMLSIYRRLDEKDRNELEFGEDYLASFVPSLDPDEVLEIMRKKPLFERIYSNQKLSDLSIMEKNSISISVYRYLSRDRGTPANTEIENAIDFILAKRRLFENEVILGGDKYLIIFNHQDPAMTLRPIKEFARERGVTKFPTINLLKGPALKQEIIDTIVNSGGQGETVIWADAHGLPNYICLGGGVPNQDGSIDEESCLGFRYDEFANILLQRGNLNGVILIIDSCFSYNFAEQLLEDLSRKNSLSYPTIITETNKGKYGYIGRLLKSLNLLNLQSGEPLLGRHIYEAEQFTYEYQDSAVFFSEDGISPPLEIAMDSLNPSECGCTGDSCLIEPVQGETS